MKVKTIMSKDLQVVNPNDKISQAVSLMSTCKLHRLPVVSENKLVGLITEKTVASSSPSKASSLSIHEMNYLLSKMKVEDIMITNVITIDGEALVEEAAALMREQEIGCLPVVNKNNELEGIITTNNVLDAFMDLVGYHQGLSHIEIAIKEDRIGILKEISEIFIKHQTNIIRFSVYQEQAKLMIIIISDQKINSTLIVDLNKAGYLVVERTMLGK
ncbi:MAG: CBS and ACT domain-containing protein [Erysipelotrichaceae bacterium]